MKKHFILLLIGLMPAISLADIQFSADEGVRILALNGKEVDQGTLFSGASELSAPNGKAQLVVEYTAEINRSADDYLLETSDTFVITLAAADTRVHIGTPEIASRYDLRVFNREGRWQLRDDSGKPLSFVFGKLEKEGFQLGRDYENELKAFNASQDKAALPELNIETHKFNSTPSTSTYSETATSDQQMVGQMLQYWYEKASPKTRKDFKRWIESGQ